MHFLSVTIGPVLLRKHIINNVEATLVQHAERFIKQQVLSVPGVGKDEFLFCSIHSPPSIQTNLNRLSEPRNVSAIFWNAESLSIETSVESSSIPSNIQDVDNPVPVPSSRNLPDGLEQASVRSNEQVKTSEAIVKPDALVASSS